MVILAVDVAGNRSTDRDKARAGRHRHEVSAWNDDRQQVVDADPGTHRDYAGLLIDDQIVVSGSQPQHVASRILGGVTV